MAKAATEKPSVGKSLKLPSAPTIVKGGKFFVPPRKELKAWSYSRYAAYKQCPLKFMLEDLCGLRQPAGEAMARGDRIHKLAEAYIRGEGRSLPKELGGAEGRLKYLRAKHTNKKTVGLVQVEQSLALTRSWSQTSSTNWKECWLRVKADVQEFDGDTINLDDWKTGKFRTDNIGNYTEQLTLYATTVLSLNPGRPMLRVVPRLWYVDYGLVYPGEDAAEVLDFQFGPRDLPSLKKDWEAKVKPMFADTKFLPRPNPFCGTCQFRKSVGGPCKY